MAEINSRLEKIFRRESNSMLEINDIRKDEAATIVDFIRLEPEVKKIFRKILQSYFQPDI
ncbi:uncharacterized protein ASCRUDRAFT_74586 [Ascoidea rubescens DSM 1968]|uniref:Uncharacterized protein n=1 Tax=Ascoidea rubescens DSM 1968 TaxID=1344418 RepID=A0A1D2VKK7_9ASCO|nr:hypothetical protein ASCRUDRAFT_74586 [Ascoidea rubescens DSM 1968]ODV62141.1 hypothetical protein ASCRUDRAFT_74586 [Ascoidea rubescens DSM 1968]